MKSAQSSREWIENSFIFSKLREARSPLYRQLRQREQAHSAAFFEDYKIHNPLHRSDLKISEKVVQFFFAKMKILFSFSFSFLQNSMNFVIFLQNFDEILSEFHEELQKIADNSDIFTKLPEKFRKILEISGFCDEFHSSVSFFSIDSLLTA